MSTTYHLEHQCPQCGAPVALTEDDRIFTCPFCRTKLLIHATDYMRYYFPPRACRPDEAIFVPYLRFKGMEFTLLAPELSHGLVDMTRQATEWDALPFSMGVRTQTLTLRFLEPATPGLFLPVASDKEDALRAIVARMGKSRMAATRRPPPAVGGTKGGGEAELEVQFRVSGGLFALLGLTPRNKAEERLASRFAGSLRAHADKATPPVAPAAPSAPEPYHAYVGETTSVIYAPFYRSSGSLLDGITGRQVLDLSQHAQLCNHARPNPPVGLRFLPALCPHCGWDLAGDGESLLLTCANCSSTWILDNGTLGAATVMSADSTLAKPDILLPFWSLTIESASIKLESFADLMRFANVPRVVRAEDEQAPLCLWAPAFKIQPGQYVRLARLATLSRRATRVREGATETPLYPASLPATEAFELVPALLGSLCPALSKDLPLIRRENFSLRTASLTLVPFTRQGYEYRQPEWKLGVHENLLRWGRSL